ncbi:MAG: septum formation initiator family protein [Holosporales bacterium]|jgi:cell division protein FtsB|nr:septum formation initiator family protein [Holosporales bacterium]
MRLYSRFVGISDNVKIAFVASLVAVVFVYFLFHAVSGENGLLSYIKVRKEFERQNEQLRTLEANLESVKRNVKLLKSEAIDVDILEERCRRMLNYSDKSDVIIKEQSIVPFSVYSAPIKLNTDLLVSFFCPIQVQTGARQKKRS